MIAPDSPDASESRPDAASALELDRAARRGALLGSGVASAGLLATALLVPGSGLRLAIVAALAILFSAAAAAGFARAKRKRALIAADRRASVAEALLANIPDPVILVDQHAIVREANAAARAFLPGLRGNNKLSFALRAPDVLEGVESVVRTGEPVTVTYSERVPTERSFEVRIGPLERPGNGGGGQREVMLFFRDLTDARRLETMRVDFIANVSHELRTPLASVLGFIETLEGPAREDAKARERFLAIMREQAKRMTRLIDDLLSLSRIELRAHMAPRTPVDLAPLGRRIVDALTPMARENKVALVVDFPVEPIMIRGDTDEMLRVFENLIENAIKYGGSGGRVEIGLERDAAENSVRLRVRDYGPGVAQDHLPRLTERFYRADANQSREKGGTGLGLAIVKHIVARHRGKLSIESELGKGMTFTAEFPAAPRDDAASA